MKESNARGDRYPEDMNSGSLCLASMGVRKRAGDIPGRGWILSIFDDRWKDRKMTSFMIYIIPTPVFAVG